MGMRSVPLVGHSMGGTTSLRFAVKYPSRVRAVTVIGSPINGKSLAGLLKLAGMPFYARQVFRLFGVFRWFMRSYYSKRISTDPDFPAIMDEDLQSLSLQSFLWSINDLHHLNLTDQLHALRVPVLGMYGDRDIIVDPYEWQTLLKGYDGARIAHFPDAGHFIMLDDPSRFRKELGGFLADVYGNNGEEGIDGRA